MTTDRYNRLDRVGLRIQGSSGPNRHHRQVTLARCIKGREHSRTSWRAIGGS